MTDTVKLELVQTDDSTKEPISRLTCEWYSQDRNIANALSMEVVQGVVDRVAGLSEVKAEVTGDEKVKTMLAAAKKARG